jgi:hypothetical protein
MPHGMLGGERVEKERTAHDANAVIGRGVALRRWVGRKDVRVECGVRNVKGCLPNQLRDCRLEQLGRLFRPLENSTCGSS